MTLRLGYNTNGFANHSLADTIDIISTIGYDGMALTLDHAHCHPFMTGRNELERLQRQLQERQLAVVIETGARYILDSRRKHEPTLVSATGRERRLAFLKRAVDIAEFLKAEAVSFFSGIRHNDVTEKEAEIFFLRGCEEILTYAHERGVPLGLEPEPGMYVDSMADFDRVHKLLDHPALKLTLDIGHLFCSPLVVENSFAPSIIEAYAPSIVNMHIEDIRNRVHHHLAFGEGEIDFAPIFQAIHKIAYPGLINVELSRDSHRAPDVAQHAFTFLSGFQVE